ncbi:MAG: SWIM zinc finger family protein [Anaerolineae bacterium]|jgi:uncharacterized Zn finger protein
MAKRRSSYYDSYWPRYTPPIRVEDGIKAKSKRGKFVKNWWADRWIKALTPLMDSGRLSRGRSYARRGQVIEIEVAPGEVESRVQGSRRTPYEVRIQLHPLSDAQWERVLDALGEQAIYSAQLLNGEMPPDVEEVFDAVDVALFPASRGDLDTYCSCPDWANPCKHVAAVYFLLGERFDEDPFLLFELRGRGQEAIASALRERRAAEAPQVEPLPPLPERVEEVEAPALEQTLGTFWTAGPGLEALTFEISAPQVEMALLKRLGLPALPGVDGEGLLRQMERVYEGVTEQALALAYAETAPG